MTQSLRIAIADDEAEIRRFFEKIVRRLGHEVIASVGNGRELVEQCRAQPPDLIITDISMPDMDGIEAACQISNEHPVPVIVISSRDTTELDNCGARKYVVAFLRKPIKTEQLATAVSEAAECDVLPRSRQRKKYPIYRSVDGQRREPRTTAFRQHRITR